MKRQLERRYFMAKICPLCNGLYAVKEKCPICSKVMEDKGPIINYLDDYSPYLLDDISSSVDGVDEVKCLHLFHCSNCNNDHRVVINRKKI